MTPTRLPVRVSRSARIEIAEQAAYYRDESGEALAGRWRASVSRAILSLRTLPERGTPAVTISPRLAGLRTIPVEGFPNHLLFYVYSAEPQRVDILSVLHGARDVEKLLGDTSKSSP